MPPLAIPADFAVLFDRLLMCEAVLLCKLSNGRGHSADLSRSLGKTHCLSAIHDPFGVYLVAGLLDGCCPSAIFRFVVSVIVDPIQRPPDRSLAHICEEVREHQPSFADCYSPAAIIPKSTVCSVQTARFHRLPDMINRRVGVSVFPVQACGHALSALASARRCIAALQRTLANIKAGATHAFNARHVDDMALMVGAVTPLRNDDQSSELLSTADWPVGWHDWSIP